MKSTGWIAAAWHRPRRLLATALLVGLLAFAAAGTASATVYRQQGGFAYTTLRCSNASTHQVTWLVHIDADAGTFTQSVGWELYFWYGGQWLTVAPWTQINLRDIYARTGSSQYWTATTPSLPGGFQQRFFYTYYYWYYAGAWSRLGEMTSVYC